LRRRKWTFRFLAASLAPLLFLTLLEAGLRVAEFGDSPRFFVPVKEGVYAANPHFGWRFFPPASARAPVESEIAVPKVPGTRRIFILGSSAAQGYPNPAFGFGRMLSAMLHEQYPGVRFEVVNAAMTAVNSHVVLPIARECASYEPDVFVIYMGNNEVVGPYGSGSTFRGFSPHLPLIRSSILLKSTRTGQLAGALLGGRGDFREWQGMSMFLEHRLAADDPMLYRIYSHFRNNLVDICAVAHRARARVVLCTVATNLKDCAPFASLRRMELPELDRRKWERLYEAGIAACLEGRYQEAAERFFESAQLDDDCADLHFRLGRCLLAINRPDDARRHFTLARELDALRFRADKQINEAIREVADECAGLGVSLVDVERAFEDSQRTQHRIPGKELFYEHVHPNPDGNYVLAKAVFEQVVRLIDLAPGDVAAAQALSQERCFERIALTESNRLQMQQDVAALLRRPPFSAQLDAALRQREQEQLLAELLASANAPAERQKAAESYTAAIERAPHDPLLRREFARLLQRHGNPDAAEPQWRLLVREYPYVAAWRLEFGEFLLHRGLHRDAMAEFNEVVRLDRSLAGPAAVGIASILAKEGFALGAERVLRQALETRSHPVIVHCALGTLLLRQDHTDDAIEQFQEAVRLDANLAAPHANLAVIHVQRGNVSEAVRHCRELLRIEPGSSEAVAVMEEVCRLTERENAEYLELLTRAHGK
jgi:tetratricopeptide (TPR) repeat protein